MVISPLPHHWSGYGTPTEAAGEEALSEDADAERSSMWTSLSDLTSCWPPMLTAGPLSEPRRNPDVASEPFHPVAETSLELCAHSLPSRQLFGPAILRVSFPCY